MTTHQLSAFRAHMAGGSKYGSLRPVAERRRLAALEVKAVRAMAGAGGWLNRVTINTR